MRDAHSPFHVYTSAAVHVIVKWFGAREARRVMPRWRGSLELLLLGEMLTIFFFACSSRK